MAAKIIEEFRKTQQVTVRHAHTPKQHGEVSSYSRGAFEMAVEVIFRLLNDSEH